MSISLVPNSSAAEILAALVSPSYGDASAIVVTNA